LASTSDPDPGLRSADVTQQLLHNTMFDLINMFGGGALRRMSIFALG